MHCTRNWVRAALTLLLAVPALALLHGQTHPASSPPALLADDPQPGGG